MNNNAYLIDEARSCCLRDTGASEYIAAVAVDTDGAEHLVLVERESVGDAAVRYDATCTAVSHEAIGPLPLEFVRRITVAFRTHRCGRPTKSGAPCRTPVAHPGDACGWHADSSIEGNQR